jgi:hypothetical protein
MRVLAIALFGIATRVHRASQGRLPVPPGQRRAIESGGDAGNPRDSLAFGAPA